MKYVWLVTKIALIISVSAFIALSELEERDFNRYLSYAIIKTNATYGSYYNPPTVLTVGGVGRDYELPLYSEAFTRKEYSDDGYNGTHNINGTEAFNYPPGNEWFLNEILKTGRYFKNNLVLENAEGVLPEVLGLIGNKDFRIYKGKNYEKKFTISAYAEVSCNDGYFSGYKTTYQFYVEVPPAFHMYNIRNLAPQTVYGSFSHSIDRRGSLTGLGAWAHELTSEPSAWAEASGHNQSSNERHNTKSKSTTPSNADVVYIDCDLCENTVCNVCDTFR